MAFLTLTISTAVEMSGERCYLAHPPIPRSFLLREFRLTRQCASEVYHYYEAP